MVAVLGFLPPEEQLECRSIRSRLCTVVRSVACGTRHSRGQMYKMGMSRGGVRGASGKCNVCLISNISTSAALGKGHVDYAGVREVCCSRFPYVVSVGELHAARHQLVVESKQEIPRRSRSLHMRRVIPLFSLLPTDKQTCFVTHHPPLSAGGRRPVRCGWLLLQNFPMCPSYPTYNSSACQNSASPRCSREPLPLWASCGCAITGEHTPKYAHAR